MSILECALFSFIAFLVIYLIFISQQTQGKPLSCEWFHKAEMEPLISATRRAKLTKTPHIMSRWVIRRHTLQHLRWERINKRSHAAVSLCCFLSALLPLGALFARGSDWEETGIVNRSPWRRGAKMTGDILPQTVHFEFLNEDHWSAFAGRPSSAVQ